MMKRKISSKGPQKVSFILKKLSKKRVIGNKQKKGG